MGPSWNATGSGVTVIAASTDTRAATGSSGAGIEAECSRAPCPAGSVILGRDARPPRPLPVRPLMAAEFNWWLLIAGVLAGGLLTWLVLADTTRHEREIADEELGAEAAWIARAVGGRVDAPLAEDVLRAHRRYLGFPPPDVLAAADELPALQVDGLALEPPPDLVEADPGVNRP